MDACHISAISSIRDTVAITCIDDTFLVCAAILVFTSICAGCVTTNICATSIINSAQESLPFPMSPMSLGKTYSKVFFLCFSSFRIFLLLFLQIYKTFYIIIRKRVKKSHKFCNYFFIISASM